jgi:hypothetical protein
MSTSNWPDASQPYEFPGGDDNKRQIWQKGIDDAISAKTLELKHVHGDVYNLEGPCPRCGHPMAQSLDFSVILPKSFTFDTAFGRSTTAAQATFDIVCSCTQEHTARGKDATGCGWGRGLPVVIETPTSQA